MSRTRGHRKCSRKRCFYCTRKDLNKVKLARQAPPLDPAEQERQSNQDSEPQVDPPRGTWRRRGSLEQNEEHKQ